MAELSDLRLRLYRNGYHPVPVTGPDAAGTDSPGKAPILRDWPVVCALAGEAQIDYWTRSKPDHTNTGILCGEIVAPDIDVMDAGLVAEIEALATHILGPTPLRRTGRAPKALLVYRTEWPFRKIKIALWREDDKEAAIEILAERNKFVAFGTHPDTRMPYAWAGRSPLDTTAAELPTVTEEMVWAFVAEAESLMVRAGYEPRGRSTAGNSDRAAANGGGELPTFDEVAEALRYVPNEDLHYDDWVRVGMALKASLGDAALPLWEEWSAQSGKNEPAVTARKWAHDFNNVTSLSARTIFYEAQQNGWINPRSRAAIEAEAERIEARIAEANATNDPGEMIRFLEQKAREKREADGDAPNPPLGIPEREDRQAPEARTDQDSKSPKASVPQSPLALHWHGEQPAKPPRWLVNMRLPETGVALWSGQWGTGKTFAFLDLAFAVMTGQPFLGEATRRRGGVLLFAMEGANELPIRLAAILETRGSGPAQNGKLPFVWVETCPPLTGRPAFATLLATAKRAADRMRSDHGLPLALIAFDTLSAAAGFKDQNDNAEAQVVMNVLRDLSRETGALALAIDHYGKKTEVGTRGASAKEGAADAVLALLGDRDEDGGMDDRVLTLRKVRGGVQGLTFGFNLKTVDMGNDEDGFEITSCVVEWAAGMTAKARKKSESVITLERIIAEAIKHGEAIEVDGCKRQAARKDPIREAFKTAWQDKHPKASAGAIRERFSSALKSMKPRVGQEIVDGVEYIYRPEGAQPLRPAENQPLPF